VNTWLLAARALRSRNYRLFFSGQSISLIGTWMTRVAIGWLVYRLTNSASMLGIIGFIGQIPTFFLAPLAGVWVDRWDRHRTLVITQLLSMVQSLALAALALGGVVATWHSALLALMQGVINAFDMPARQAFVVQMVDRREDVGNAIALNSSIVNAARLVGPALAGVVISAVGEGYCFLIDGLSYIAVVVSLLLMRAIPATAPKARRRLDHELGEGWRYVATFAPIRSLLLLLGLVSVVGMPYTILMPVFASDILHGDAHTLGFLMAASGVGALAGAITLALRKTVLGLGRRIVVVTAMAGVALIVFGFSRWLWLSLAVLPLAGYGIMQQMAASNTILQTIVDDDKRGRVMAFYAMSLMGMTPFGSLLAGSLASLVGAPLTIAMGGALCVAGSLWFRRALPEIRLLVHPIYARLGILPQVAAGLQQASSAESPDG
jgi:MFS family permease